VILEITPGLYQQ